MDAVSQSLNVKRPFGLPWCVELCASFTHGLGRLVSDALKASCQSGCASRVTVLVWAPRKNDVVPQLRRHTSNVSKDEVTVVLRNVAKCSAVDTA